MSIFWRYSKLSLLDIVGIELQVSDLLGVRGDLSEEGTLKPRVREAVEAEAMRAF
jgi:predicted nucleotidyltransferase